MTSWNNKKTLGTMVGNQIIVEEGDLEYRVTYGGKWYYVNKDEESIEGFIAEDYTTFLHRIEELNKRKPTRKERRKYEQRYKRIMNKIQNQAKNKANEVGDLISEDSINNPDASIEEIKEEVVTNIRKALDVTEEETIKEDADVR